MSTLATPGQAGLAGTLGVLGGGQLGRMFVHAAQAQGFRCVVLEPDLHSPAAAAADAHLALPYDDAAALAGLAAQCAAVTTEFENVPAPALQLLAEAGVTVAPAAAAVQVCQHRVREKQCFVDAGVPCAPFAVIYSINDLDRDAADVPADAEVPPGHVHLTHLLPGILKTASLGYDGKGQRAVQNLADAVAAWHAFGCVPCVLERRLALAQEISVIVARARDGSAVHLPVQQNLHRDGVLALTQVPAPDVVRATADQAVAWALQLAHRLNYVGVLCVEFFVLADGSLVANEMAPRPHNSGHYSIDACDLSQFDLQLRTLVGWPLWTPRQHSAAVMLNLMGDLWFAGQAQAARAPDWHALTALPGSHLHLYGKTDARRGRKMGHLTMTATTAAQARTVALQAANLLGLPAF